MVEQRHPWPRTASRALGLIAVGIGVGVGVVGPIGGFGAWTSDASQHGDWVSSTPWTQWQLSLPFVSLVAGLCGWVAAAAGIGLLGLQAWGRRTLEGLLSVTLTLSLIEVGFLAVSFSTVIETAVEQAWAVGLLGAWFGAHVVVLTFLRSPEIRAQFGEGWASALTSTEATE